MLKILYKHRVPLVLLATTCEERLNVRSGWHSVNNNMLTHALQPPKLPLVCSRVSLALRAALTDFCSKQNRQPVYITSPRYLMLTKGRCLKFKFSVDLKCYVCLLLSWYLFSLKHRNSWPVITNKTHLFNNGFILETRSCRRLLLIKDCVCIVNILAVAGWENLDKPLKYQYLVMSR